MSRFFEALSNLNFEIQAQSEKGSLTVPPGSVMVMTPGADEQLDQHAFQAITDLPIAADVSEKPERTSEFPNPLEPRAEPSESSPVRIKLPLESRLVALTDPTGLGAEKFRALVTRFDHLRRQRELKSLQVTSSIIHEGKTLISGNLGVTLAKYSGAKTLLVEGDLHRPTLSSLMGIGDLPGLMHWWRNPDAELENFVHRVNDIPLWFLSAGTTGVQPSDLLRSPRFQKAFTRLARKFDWVVVDSTPMQPIVDVNLWARVLDGTLLVVREGLTPIAALKRGLQALDQPKVIGVVVNEASDSEAEYQDRYYETSEGQKKKRSYNPFGWRS